MSQEKIKNRIDYKGLSETLSIQTKHGNDEAMLDYIKEKLGSLEVTVQEDEYGNIYVTKGNAKYYPCVVAHTDTVQSVLTNVSIYRSEDTIFAFDPIKRRQHGIGGDDKVGVYIALQLLVDLPTLKVVFYRDEEIGCLGSTYSMKHHLDWYKDCGYVMMADRRGNNEAIRVSGGIVITSDEFLEACKEQLSKYEYVPAIGLLTDVDNLVAGGIGVSAINLSCGYHEPHSSIEIVSFKDVNRCYNLMYDILVEHNNKRFEHEYEPPIHKPHKGSKSAYNSYYNDLSKYASPVSNSLRKRQEKMFPPLVLGDKRFAHDNFIETDVTKNKQTIYEYRGTKSLPLTGEVRCPNCNNPVLENVFYLPFEGRMFCTSCNDYVDDTKVGNLLQHLEVEDRDDTFVYSVYSSGWIKKNQATWSDKLGSWVTNGLPF